MNVPFCLICDYDDDDDEYLDIMGCVHLASIYVFNLANILFSYFNSEEGQTMLNLLEIKQKEVALLEILPKTRGITSIKILVTGSGLISRIRTKDGKVEESDVSCLFTCYVGEFANKSIFKEEKLIAWLKSEFKKQISKKQ